MQFLITVNDPENGLGSGTERSLTEQARDMTAVWNRMPGISAAIEVHEEDVYGTEMEPTSLINPGNERTFTVSEAQASDIIDSLNDRVEGLDESAAALDIHTPDEVAYFTETAAELRAIVAIIDGDPDLIAFDGGVRAVEAGRKPIRIRVAYPR